MINRIETRLRKLGIELEPPKTPVANYLSTKTVDNLLFVSGRKSELVGEVGSQVTEAQAKEAAKETVISLLSIIKQDIKDLDRIAEIVKLQGFIRSAPHFDRQPQVLDGASDLLIKIFGEHGRHARTATGVAQLPFGASVQLDMIIKLKTD